MRLAAFALVLISSLTLSQTTKDPSHPSRHASVGRKYGRSGTVNTPNTTALTNELAKIEQQGAHAPASSTVSRTSTAAAVPKSPPAQNKNKPIKYSYRPPQGSHTARPH